MKSSKITDHQKHDEVDSLKGKESLGNSSGTLVKLFVGSRIFFTFIVIPLIHLVWNKRGHLVDHLPYDSNQNSFDYFLIRPLKMLISFDAEHFIYIAEFGYTNEKNHAFYPGYPMLLNLIANVSGTSSATIPDLSNNSNFLILAYTVQLIIGSLNAVLIYKVGVRLLTLNLFNGRADDTEYPLEDIQGEQKYLVRAN